MILLDTSYLIGVLVKGSEEGRRLLEWLPREELCTTAVAWYDLLSGPLPEEGLALVSAILHDRIIPFTGDLAREAARLWNAVGRRRNLRVAAMIAGAAIVLDAELATANLGDFAHFRALGLKLVA